MNSKEQPHLPASPKSRFSGSLAYLIGSLVIVVIFVLLLVGSYLLLKPGSTATGNASQPAVLPAVRLTQQAALNSLGWVNKGASVAHIPIGRAMQIIATQGIPTFTAPPANPTPTP